MTPITFMTHSMAIDLRKSVVVSWTPVRLSSMLQQGSLPLCPPAITFIYFFLKACSYVFNAISHQTKGRVATAMPGSGQQEHCTDTGEEGHTEKFANKYKEIFQNNMAEGQNNPQGPFFYQEGGKTYASLPLGMIQDIQKSPLFVKSAKGLQSRRHRTPEKYYGKGPEDPCVNPTGIFTKRGSQGQCLQ